MGTHGLPLVPHGLPMDPKALGAVLGRATVHEMYVFYSKICVFGNSHADPPGPGDPPPGWYERPGFETVRFKTEDAFGISPNVVYQGQGGGNTTVINQAPPKNKTAAVQMLRENVRNNAAGVQRRNYNYAKSRGTQSSIPGTVGLLGGSLNIPGVG